MEIHTTIDQFFRIEKGNGNGKVTYGKDKTKLTEDKLGDGTAFVIPMNTWHNIINIDEKEPLKLYTIYAPPNHADKLIQQNKPMEGGKYYQKYCKYKNKYSKSKITQ